MTTKSGIVQLKDIKAGKTFYYVMCYLQEDRYAVSKPERIAVVSKPYFKKTTNSLWYDCMIVEGLLFPDTELWRESKSTHDSNIYESGDLKRAYNLHRVYKTRRQAQRYYDRMSTAIPTKAEVLERRSYIARLDLIMGRTPHYTSDTVPMLINKRTRGDTRDIIILDEFYQTAGSLSRCENVVTCKIGDTGKP